MLCVVAGSVAKTSPTLVTGGTGFLGRRLVEQLLAEGRSITVLGRTPAADLEARGVRFIRASLDDATGARIHDDLVITSSTTDRLG